MKSNLQYIEVNVATQYTNSIPPNSIHIPHNSGCTLIPNPKKLHKYEEYNDNLCNRYEEIDSIFDVYIV